MFRYALHGITKKKKLSEADHYDEWAEAERMNNCLLIVFPTVNNCLLNAFPTALRWEAVRALGYNPTFPILDLSNIHYISSPVIHRKEYWLRLIEFQSNTLGKDQTGKACSLETKPKQLAGLSHLYFQKNIWIYFTQFFFKFVQ